MKKEKNDLKMRKNERKVNEYFLKDEENKNVEE